MANKPAPRSIVGCEYCNHRVGEFFKDKEEPEIIRCYCNARHTYVNAELMTKFCDFFSHNPDYKPKEKKSKTKGI